MDLKRVLLVADEPILRQTLVADLRSRGFEVVTASSGTQALAAAARARPEVVLLDLGLPDMEGADVVRGLRDGSAVPIVLLSARGNAQEQRRALDAGADSHLSKPFTMDQVLALLRVAASSRPAGPAAEPYVRTASFTVDLRRGKVTRDGADVHLTPIEWRLIEVLARHAGRLVGHRQLLQEVWGPAYGTETNYLRIYLVKLRKKLEPEPSRPRHLLTEPGRGVRLEP